MLKKIPGERSNLSCIFWWDGQYLTELRIVVSYLAKDVVLEWCFGKLVVLQKKLFLCSSEM